MLRLTIPGGVFSSAQMKAVAKIALDQAGDLAQFTPSGEIHLQLDPAASPEVAPSLEGLGLQVAGEQGDPSLPAAQGAPDHRGVHEQAQAGLFSVAVLVPGGRISGRQMRKLADLAERYGSGTVRLSGGQKLFLWNLPKEKVLQALEGLESVDLKVQSVPFPGVPGSIQESSDQ